jgi:hypothetical protein
MSRRSGTEYCKNCGSELRDMYCAHCGQKARTERITLIHLLHEFFHFFTHIERGFLFTSWHMLTVPGKTVKEYIDGKRRIHQSPISYFVIWTTVYILFLYWTERRFGENIAIDYKEYYGPVATTRFAISHLSIVLIGMMPFLALYLWLLVTLKQYYYFETMIAIIYAFGTVLLLQFVFAVGAAIVHSLNGISVGLRISDVLKISYIIWFIFDFVKLFPVNHKFIRAAVFIILAFGTLTLWRIYGLPLIIQMIFLKD